jgi:hypothetical protein
VTGTRQQLVNERGWTTALTATFIAHIAEETLSINHLHGTLIQEYSSNSLSPSEHLLANSILCCIALLWLGIAFRTQLLT